MAITKVRTEIQYHIYDTPAACPAVGYDVILKK